MQSGKTQKPSKKLSFNFAATRSKSYSKVITSANTTPSFQSQKHVKACIGCKKLQERWQAPQTQQKAPLWQAMRKIPTKPSY